MKILLITPAPRLSLHGNRVTALRWARILPDLGHCVVLEHQYSGGDADLMLALHARKSFPAVAKFHREHPNCPVVVALTDLTIASSHA